MGLFDIFTGSNEAKAAEQSRAYLQQQQNQINEAIQGAQTGGIAALQSGQTGGLGAIQAGTGTARGDITSSTLPALSSLYGGQALGAGALTGAQAPALSALQSGVSTAMGGYAPLQEAAGRYGAFGTQASQMSADAAGLNGPEGIARAQAAFQANPGYQFALGQGLESIARNANVAGMGAGGNALVEAQRYGQGLAQQEYDKWKTSLAQREGLYAPLEQSALGQAAGGVGQAALTGATGAANIYTGTGGRLSDLYSQTGQGGANIYGQAGQSLANLAAQGGLNQANLYGQTGQSTANLLQGLVGTQAGFAGQIAPQYSKTYADEAAAKTGGSQNMWNAIGGAASMMAGGLI